MLPLLRQFAEVHVRDSQLTAQEVPGCVG